MGQVPLMLPTIVGNGRLARHLAHWLALEGIPYRQWSRSEARTSGETLSEATRGASAMLLAVSDHAIAGLATELRSMAPDTRLYHLSGALHLDQIPALHPLMTFGPSLYAQDTYRAIHWVCDPGHRLQDIFPGLPNPSHELSPKLRPYYHALCVISGNFPQILWQKAWRDLPMELGLPPEALRPYLQQTLSNFMADPFSSLTGPLARGDRSTIALNLDSLKGDPFKPIYQSFVELMLDENRRLT